MAINWKRYDEVRGVKTTRVVFVIITAPLWVLPFMVAILVIDVYKSVFYGAYKDIIGDHHPSYKPPSGGNGFD